MKKYEYKTEFIPLPVEKIQDALCEFASFGWRTVQTSPVKGGSIVILEREIEADSEDEYDIIPSDGLCHIESRGVIKECSFYKRACPDWALRRCDVDNVIFVRKGGEE